MQAGSGLAHEDSQNENNAQNGNHSDCQTKNSD